jgi:hypothetical protein
LAHALKPIFDWITGNYTLFENPIYNYLIMGVIGLIAFGTAWNMVGDMYRGDIISSKEAGSIFHWIIRLFVFSILFLVISVVMWIVRLIMHIQIWGWIIILLLGVFNLAIRVRKRRLKEKT